MAALIGALRVSLSADTAAFITGMKQAEGQASRSANAIQKQFSNLKASILSGLTVGALTNVTARALEYASSLGEVAQQLGVSAEQLQVFRYAATQVGISQEEMDRGLQKFTKSLGDAKNGSAQAIKVFTALGFSKQDIARLDVHEALLKTADGIAAIGDRSRRATPETALFGKAGQQLDTLLSGGSRAIKQLAEEAKSLGIILSDEQIQRADETADKLGQIKRVLEARIAGVVADNAQSILTLANALSAVAAGVLRFLASNPRKAAMLLAAIGGYAVGGPVGAAASALAAAGYASLNDEKGLRTQLNVTKKNLLNYYVQNGGTEAEIRSRKFNPAVLKKIRAKPGYAEYTSKIRDLNQRLAEITGAGSIAAPTPTSGDGGLGQFLAGPGKKPPKGKSAEALAREAERKRKDALRDEFDAASGQRRADVDILQARQDLSQDIKERAGIEREILQKEHEEREARINLDLALGDINETTAQKRRESEATLAGLLREKADRDEFHDLLQEELRIRDSVAEFATDTLQAEQALAATAAERRDIENRILDERLKMLKQAQQDIIDNREGKYSESDINLARRTLSHIDRVEPLQREAIRRDTAGPLESFFNTLPNTAAKANEAMEEVAAGGIASVVDGLAEAASGARSLGDVFKNVARQIVADLIRIQLQKAIVGALSKALTSVGSFGSGLSGKAAADRSMVGDIPGFATGGSMILGGRRGYDTNLLSLNGAPLARVSHGERLTISARSAEAGAGRIAQIVPSAYFDVVVDGRVVRTAGPMAARAASLGAAGGQAAIYSRARRRLP